MTPDEFKKRTRKFALRIIKLVQSLPRNPACDVMGRQLLKAGTSTAANYRAACRAKSRADFRAKMGIVEEERDESHFWLEMLVESGVVSESAVKDLMQEASEITAMTVSSIKNSRP
jgi:four helix bundle protein